MCLSTCADRSTNSKKLKDTKKIYNVSSLCSFSCYESPRRFGDAAAGGLVSKSKVKSKILAYRTEFLWSNQNYNSLLTFSPQCEGGTKSTAMQE